MSPPMEVLTSYDVSPHLYYGGGSRSGDLINTNCHGLYNSPLDIVPAQVSHLPNDIVIDILSRLPVKPLMQFKSVCKKWLSLIKHDTVLNDLHFIRSKSRPYLLYIDPLPEKGVLDTCLDVSFERSKTLQQSITCAQVVEGSGGEEDAIRITDDKWFLYNQILEPVNGLVCFIDLKTYAIKVYNASTRQETPWVKSTLLAEENAKLANKDSMMRIKSLCSPIYRFGFDPEKKEHKIFCFWRLVARLENQRYNSKQRPDYESWEALAVGRDTKWRRINAVPNENNQIKIQQALPPANSSMRNVYADGTIYWSNKEDYWDVFKDSNPDDPSVIVAFDVGSEKYRVIPIPDFILHEPRDETFRKPIGMLALDRHVALVYRIEPYVVKLWMLDDGVAKKLDNCRGNKSNWIAETITLPFCCDDGFGCFGIAGSTDKIIFESPGFEDSVSVVDLYSYDRRKTTCEKIEMDGVASFTEHSERSILTTFTESLFPVLDKS